jgi:hypothetical protein
MLWDESLMLFGMLCKNATVFPATSDKTRAAR